MSRSVVWREIWRRKGALVAPLHHVDGYDVLDEAGWEAMIRALVAGLRLDPGMDVVEFGCGAGAFLRTLAKIQPGMNLTGIDYAPELIALATSSGPGRFLPGDIRGCPALPTAGYDLVCSFGTMMYLDGQDEATQALDEMRRVARPGADIFIGEVSDAERRELADAMRATTHANRPQVSAARPDHLYLPMAFFAGYAAQHGLALQMLDHRDLPFAAANPLAAYRYSVVLRARG